MSEQRTDGRALRYRNRREEILASVLDHLLEHGIHGLSFRKLGAAVGVSHVTLRHHFGTKDELLLAVMELIRTREPVPAELPTDRGPEDVVRQLWRWWTQPENLRYYRLMYEAYGLALQSPTVYQGFLQSTVPHWVEDTRRLALEAGCPPERADALATLLVAQLRGLLLDLLTTGEDDRISDALELLVEGLVAERRAWA